MGERDDGLGLSLGLGRKSGAINEQPLRLNVMPMVSSITPNLHNHALMNPTQKNPWSEIFPSSGMPERIPDTRSFFRGIDVNRAPSVVDCEDDNGVSSPNSTVSSISGKRSEKEPVGDETEAERTSCSHDDDDGGGGDGGGSDDEDGNGDASRKKLRLTKEQSLILEETFKEHNTLNPKEKLALAKKLNLRARQVEVWFQNRRARTKLKQTEVDCEYLKRCCENLTEENRRLQKEVVELRALKLSPQLYRQMSPPTTLTMCPSCERVAVSTSSSSVAVSPATVQTQLQMGSSSQTRNLPTSPWAGIPINQHR